ncbi:MAG: DegT/DnrJ/EryC1/StrS family aminotransferase [Thermodesulfobacteriota bacterium]|nr:DegT/DnrJ/EryC1/StrS family aminotransferase [Thermodesulfobacteriota bacterium]
MKMIPVMEPSFEGNEERYLMDALQSGWISSKGKYIELFEKGFAGFLGAKYAVAVSSGTTALHLALVALGIGEGDEVVVPNLTFAASANAVIHAGATPVFVDSMESHWNIDPKEVRKVISHRTKAIMPVHLLGYPCLMGDILEIAGEYSCFVVEDCAEAHGASINGKRVGSIGEIGCFSFYGNKIITMGEGGICVTDDQRLYEKMRILRDHGMNPLKTYWHDMIGYNYRLTNLSAAIGVAQLERLDEILEKRKSLRFVYYEELQGISGLEFRYESPGEIADWLFPVFIDENILDISRDELIVELKKRNIDTRPLFYPLHKMPPYRNFPRGGGMPNSELFARSGILLPFYTMLEPEKIRYIGKKIRELCG